MFTTSKRYKRPFVADKSKLTRIVGIIEEGFREVNEPLVIKYEARVGERRTITMDSIDEVFGLDNTKRSEIKQLLIIAESSSHDDSAAEASRKYSCQIDFDGNIYATVDIDIKGISSKWVYELSSRIEEQVERTLQQSAVYRLKSGTRSYILMMMSFLLLLFTITTLINSSGVRSLRDTMWLTNGDIAELQHIVKDTPSDADIGLFTYDVIKRQLANLSATDQNETVFQKLMSDWRVLLMLIPAAIVMITLGYLYIACYPTAVFLWGDEETRYESILDRRKTLWQLVIWAIIIGVIGNLFVVGFSGFFGFGR